MILYKELKSNQEIIDKYLTNNIVNFLAFVITPWQAHGVDFIIERLKLTGLDINGLIIICGHKKTGYCIDEKNFINLNMGKFLFINYPSFEKASFNYDDIKYYLRRNYKKKVSEKKYIINPFGVSYDLISKWNLLHNQAEIINIVIDEGLGHYFRKDINWLLENDKKINLFSLTILIMKKYLKKVLINILRKRQQYISCDIFSIDVKKGIIANEEIIKCYKKILKERAVNCGTTDYNNCFLINTQAFNLDHSDKSDFDLMCLQVICEEILKRGYRVILKPHPREKENIKRYYAMGIEIDENYELSQELLLFNSTNLPVAIVGFYSTTLITARVFLDIPAISLNKLVIEKVCNKATRYDMKTFIKTFSKDVFIPGNMEEFKNYIKEI